MIEFGGFCLERFDAPRKGAPPPKAGQEPEKEARYSLSIDKFRLALEIFEIEDKRTALEWASEFAGAAEDAKTEGMERGRRVERQRLARRK